MVSIGQVETFLSCLQKANGKGLWLNKLSRETGIHKTSLYNVAQWCLDRDMVTVTRSTKGVYDQEFSLQGRYRNYYRITDEGKNLIRTLEYYNLKVRVKKIGVV